jgi:hypothetical protein
MLNILLGMLWLWEDVLAQGRTVKRAIRQGVSLMCVCGRRTIAQSIVVRGDGQRDWSAEYKLHARAVWNGQEIFAPLFKQALKWCAGEWVVMGIDDTRVKRTGMKIPGVHYGRDPLGPKFRVNLQRGLRYVHGAILLPLYTVAGVTARALPMWWELTAPPRKPGKEATAEEKRAYRAACKTATPSAAAVAMIAEMRAGLDAAGGRDKRLLVVVDGGYTNQTLYKSPLERTDVIGRTRKDAKLCYPGKGKKTYDPDTFTPEQVRTNETITWQVAPIFHGGAMRDVRYKEVNQVLWQRGAGPRPVRLIVVAPTPYRRTKNGKKLYRHPAYLLTTDVTSPVEQLIQAYFDRVQIEVAHRELKTDFGLGEAQVWSPRSVERQPAFVAALYTALHLAGLEAFGAKRSERLGKLPRWQRDKTRASCRDLFLRHEVVNNPEMTRHFDLSISAADILAAAGR